MHKQMHSQTLWRTALTDIQTNVASILCFWIFIPQNNFEIILLLFITRSWPLRKRSINFQHEYFKFIHQKFEFKDESKTEKGHFSMSHLHIKWFLAPFTAGVLQRSPYAWQMMTQGTCSSEWISDTAIDYKREKIIRCETPGTMICISY